MNITVKEYSAMMRGSLSENELTYYYSQASIDDNIGIIDFDKLTTIFVGKKDTFREVIINEC